MWSIFEQHSTESTYFFQNTISAISKSESSVDHGQVSPVIADDLKLSIFTDEQSTLDSILHGEVLRFHNLDSDAVFARQAFLLMLTDLFVVLFWLALLSAV